MILHAVLATSCCPSPAARQELGENRFREVLRYLDDGVRDAIAKRGGKIVFGSSERGLVALMPSNIHGVGAAIDIQRRVDRQWADEHFGVRTCVHSGDVNGNGFQGDPPSTGQIHVDLAWQVMLAALPGQILTTGRVYQDASTGTRQGLSDSPAMSVEWRHVGMYRLDHEQNVLIGLHEVREACDRPWRAPRPVNGFTPCDPPQLALHSSGLSDDRSEEFLRAFAALQASAEALLNDRTLRKAKPYLRMDGVARTLLVDVQNVIRSIAQGNVICSIKILDGNQFRCVYPAGGTILPELKEAIADLPADRSYAGRALQNDDIVIVPDFARDDHKPEWPQKVQDAVQRFRIVGVALCPIRICFETCHRPIAVLKVDFLRKGGLQDSEFTRGVLRLVANQIALSWQYAMGSRTRKGRKNPEDSTEPDGPMI